MIPTVVPVTIPRGLTAISANVPALVTCDEIREAVSKYNADNSGCDRAMTAAIAVIQSLAPTFERFLLEVCLISDWGSIPLRTFSFPDRIAMAHAIEAAWPVLQSMRNWHPETWDAETEMLIDGVQAISHTRLLPAPGAAKRQLSFLSKYFYACVNTAFPIWDKNARTALNNRNEERTWPSYKDWLIHVRQNVSEHKACCLEGAALAGECLSRTFDKALYIIGGDILAGRGDVNAEPPEKLAAR